MVTFITPPRAKQYLIDQLTTEAARQGTPLNEVERKMLHYTESAENLPDMAEVSEDFDLNYNQPEYESRIASLAGEARTHDPATWDRAVKVLKAEDHYLLVCIDPRAIRTAQLSTTRNTVVGSFKLLATAILCILLLGLVVYFANR